MSEEPPCPYFENWSKYVDDNFRGVRFRQPDEDELQFIRDNYTYDPETGDVCRNGRSVSFINIRGYLYSGTVTGRSQNAHRIAWFIHTGAWPKAVVDHINGDRLDNRIANLRLATNSQNLRNQKLRKDNTSGHRGVWKRPDGMWVATISHNGTGRYLGSFKEFDGAVEAYRAASRELHGEFGRTD